MKRNSSVVNGSGGGQRETPPRKENQRSRDQTQLRGSLIGEISHVVDYGVAGDDEYLLRKVLFASRLAISLH